MPSFAVLGPFLIATFILAITPGPSMIHVLSSSVRINYKAGFMSVLGSTVGRFIHTFAVAFGLSALLLAVPLAFEILKIAGAAYLVYLGIKTLITRTHAHASVPARPRPLSYVFYQGVLTNLLNPKVALFFIAFLPQFVDQTRSDVTLQIIVLGTLLNIVNTLFYLALIGLSNRATTWLSGNSVFSEIQRWVTGSVFIFFGTTLLFTEQK